MKATIIPFALLVMGSLVATATPLKHDGQKLQFTQISPVSAASGTFSTFMAHRKQNGVALAWTVNTPGVDGFIIERSYDGTFFETIDHVPPAAGARNRYEDNSVLPGHIYYRAKAVLADGTVDYSETVMVRIVRHG